MFSLPIDEVSTAVRAFGFDSDFVFWKSTHLNARNLRKIQIEVSYVNPEIDGTWIFALPVTEQCFRSLRDIGLIELDPTRNPEERLYRLKDVTKPNSLGDP